MEIKIPYPENVDHLKHLIESNQWSNSWKLEKLELNSKREHLWLRLGQTIWNKAYPKKKKNSCSRSQPDNPDKDDEYLYSSEEQIAHILMGHPIYCEKEPTVEAQRDFETITQECKKPDELASVGRDLHLIYLEIVQQGNDVNNWELCPPSYPVLIKRPTPRIQINNIHLMHEAKNIRKLFYAALKENPAWLSKHRVASCLLSAALWGGLIEKAALSALYKNLDTPFMTGVSGNWIDLHIYPENPLQSRIRRFWLDPITTLFWLNLPTTPPKHESIEKLIHPLLKNLENSKDISFKNLLEGLAQEVSNELPEVLVHIATGQTRSHPIKADRWGGIQNIILTDRIELPSYEDLDEPLILSKKEIKNLEKEGSENDPLLELITPRGMTELRAAIRSKSIKSMSSKLREFLINKDKHLPIINHLTKWLIKPSGANRISTINWMFGLIGARLVSLLGELDPKLCTLQEIEEVYLSVLDDGKTESHRNGMRYSLLSFSSYLLGVEECKKLAFLRVQEKTEVSSRIITQEEYIESLKQLGRPIPSNNNPEWNTACQIILILLFRLGLRRQELLYLPLHDIHGEEFIEILIRPHEERNIKTVNALRKLQLSGFLSDEEEKIIRKWLQKRRSSELNNPTSDYLFALPNEDISLISQDSIINRIVAVVREVTQDKHFHIHHLRHSFATWAAMSIIGNIVEDDFTSWNHLPLMKSWLQNFPSLFGSLYIREPPQHSRIFLLSTLLGHSTPAISMEHYIHGLDQILGNAIWRFFSVNPNTINPEFFDIPLRTYQRWSTDGWSSIIEHLIKKKPNRCIVGTKKKLRKKTDNTPNELFNYYYEIWETLKVIYDNKLSLDNDELKFKHKDEDVKKWFNCSAELHKRGFINKTYPTFPQGEMSKKRLTTYANQFQDLLQKSDGKKILSTLLSLWKKNKLKNKSSVRFNKKTDALFFMNSLLNAGFPWSQIKLTWIGSSFTKSKEKNYKSLWRKELKIPKRITISTQSLSNNRPLDKTQGYMDIKIINKEDTNKAAANSSKEFQWIMWMAIISQ